MGVIVAKFNDMNKLFESKEDIRKFTNWILDYYKGLDSSSSDEDIADFARRDVDNFLELKQRIKSPYNDFYYWMKNSTQEDFLDYLSNLRVEVNNKKLKDKKEKDGARLVYSDDTWKVYEITTYEASAKYGKGTKWCISGSKRWANGERGSEYFDDYYSQNGVKFYFFINKDGNKYALAVYPEGSCEIFNAEDVAIPFIPNAPTIDEIKANYRNNSDFNILVNAIMNQKIDEYVLNQVIEEVYSDYTGYTCYVYSDVDSDNYLYQIADMIPDGYLEFEACACGEITPEQYKEITGEEYTDDIWGGDIPYFADFVLSDYIGNTKDEVLESIKKKVKDGGFEYVILEEDYAGWYITPIKDFMELILWGISMLGANDWSDGELDDFYLNNLSALDIEQVPSGRIYVFPTAIAVRLLVDIRDGVLSSSVISNIGLSKDFLSKFNESLGNLYSKSNKVSQNVLNEANNGDVYYHGSTETDLQVLNKPINWITKDYEYAKYYALSTNNTGYVYSCNPSFSNTFDMGRTGYRVYDVLPIKPYRLSREFEAVIRKLELNQEQVNKLLENVIHEWNLPFDGYKMMLSTVARSTAFKRVLESKGFDSIHAIEYNKPQSRYCDTFGIFDNVKVLDKEEVKLGESINEDAETVKIICLVNNYQYGETRFEKLRQQYGYDEEVLDSNHHLVWLELPQDSLAFVKKLLNADKHDNVVKASGFSRLGWIETFKHRLKSVESLKESYHWNVEFTEKDVINYAEDMHCPTKFGSGPCILMGDGTVYYIGGSFDTHPMFFGTLASSLGFEHNDDWDLDEEATEFAEIELGIITLNDGTTEYEDRPKIVIEPKPTSAQYNAIREYIDIYLRKRLSARFDLYVFANSHYQIYDMSQYTGDDIVKKIKKAYAFDRLEESINEEKAITWGDLDFGKKAETRERMTSGRGTGHFGTGFYFVGANGPLGIKDGKIPYDYEPSRPIYEIDLDAYNLYRPKDNNTGYKIHDAMASINNYYSPDMNRFLFSDIDVDHLEDNFYSAISGKLSYEEDFDDDDFIFDDDIDFDDSFIDDEDEEEEESEPRKGLDEYLKAVKKWVEDNELTDWVDTGYDDFDTWLNKNSGKLGLIEREVVNALQNRDKYIGYVEYAIDVLCKEFNVDRNTLIAMCKAFYNMKSDDTISTLLFKEFGYEGVDVTHLNHDAQGLSGLDNFGYGTVIYDLKPGTFKKIADPRKIKKEDLKEYFEKIEDTGEKWYGYAVMDDCPLYVTDEPYRIKSMLEKGDTPYRIYNASGVYLIQDARGNKTHSDMYHKAMDEYFITEEQAYGEADGYNGNQDYLYMVFIPTDFDGELRWHTKLGVDNYYDCRVYPYGVMFVRSRGAYKNNLFSALGEPEREIKYLRGDGKVRISQGTKTTEVSVGDDLNGNPNNAITFNTEGEEEFKLPTELELRINDDMGWSDDEWASFNDDEKYGVIHDVLRYKYGVAPKNFNWFNNGPVTIVCKDIEWTQQESLNEDAEDKTLRFNKNELNRLIAGLKPYYKNLEVKKLPVDKLVKDNDLLNDDDLESYHQGEWKHAKAKDFHIDQNIIDNTRATSIPFVIQKKDGTLSLSDGRHRTRAAYNDGYKYVEYPTYIEEGLNEMKGKGSLDNDKIKQYFNECINEMKKIHFWDTDYVLTYDDIDLKYGDALGTFGTFYWPDTEKENGALILNKYMFEEPEEAIKNTIYHELCHYVVFKWGLQKGVYYTSGYGHWKQNIRNFDRNDWSAHGRMWKYVAYKVGQAVGQDIRRTDSYKKHTGVGTERQNRYKYMFRCKGCGNEFGYVKRTKFVDTYMDMSKYSNKPVWSCPKCGAGTHDGDKPPFEMIKGK